MHDRGINNLSWEILINKLDLAFTYAYGISPLSPSFLNTFPA